MPDPVPLGMRLGRHRHLLVMSLDRSPEQLLALLEAAILSAPAFEYQVALTDDDLRWLGRAQALLNASGEIAASAAFAIARDNINTHLHNRSKILIPLHDAYSRVELMVPAASRGAFIPAGDTWNGYAAIVKVVQKQCDDLLVVDPYLDSTLFIEFAPLTAARVGVRCLTAQRSANDAGLLASAKRWAGDAAMASKPVEVRYAPAAALHDRLLILDGKEVWLVSQSLKDIAKRSPASVSRAEADLGIMKAKHYDALWGQSTVIS
jgi:hypothetical protein